MNHMTGIDLTVNANEIVIAYDDFGNGKLPIIFVHGFPFDKSSWQPQLELLSKQHRTIAYDIRGFGKSGDGAETPSIFLYARDLIAFMDVLEIDKAVVCGLSMGGYILLNAVALFPDRFAAVILCDTQCISDTPEVKAGRSKTIDLIKSGGKKEFADGFIKKLFSATTFETKPEVVSAINQTILGTDDATIMGTLSALAERDEMCGTLSKITVPVLILCGESDVITPLDQSKLMKSKIPNATLHSIGEAGHLSNLEQPDIFSEHISQFLSKMTG